MLRKAFLISLLVALIIVGLGVAPQTAHASTYLGTVQLTCTTLTAAGTGAHILDRDNTGVNQEQLRILVTDGAGTILYELIFQNALGTYAGGTINTTLYVTAPQFNPITYQVISLAGNGLAEHVDVTASGACAGLPIFGQGCDSFVALPAGSVVGQVLLGTPVFWGPDTSKTTGVSLEAGKTFWVAGVNAGGTFYKVLVQCQFVWVPRNTMGPNYDSVWNGRPLPTTVVE